MVGGGAGVEGAGADRVVTGIRSRSYVLQFVRASWRTSSSTNSSSSVGGVGGVGGCCGGAFGFGGVAGFVPIFFCCEEDAGPSPLLLGGEFVFGGLSAGWGIFAGSATADGAATGGFLALVLVFPPIWMRGFLAPPAPPFRNRGSWRLMLNGPAEVLAQSKGEVTKRRGEMRLKGGTCFWFLTNE